MVLVAYSDENKMKEYLKTIHVPHIKQGPQSENGKRLIFQAAMKVLNTTDNKDEYVKAKRTIQMIQSCSDKGWRVEYYYC